MPRLVHLLLLLLLTYQLVVQAADVPSNSSHEEMPTNCVDSCPKRTLFSIIWGCILTTMICAWAAIHPNIPPRESHLMGILRRLELMFWTIVAPEILPAWALNQLLAAMTVRDVYNKDKGYKKESCGFVKRWFSLEELPDDQSQAWTLKHGHFLIMGGFQLVEPVRREATTGTQQAASDVSKAQSKRTLPVKGRKTDPEKGRAPSGNNGQRRVTILTLEMLRELVKDPEFKIQITEDEITQRSKGDALSKIIFILQSSWFIMQFIARHTQGLSFTHLELTTLGLASLNGITFLLWWDKPLGAQALVQVRMKRKLTEKERAAAERTDGSARSEFAPSMQGFFRRYMAAIQDIILCRSEANIFVAWLSQLPLFIFVFLLSPIIAFASAFLRTIADLLGRSSSFPGGATHVPTFYVPRHRYSANFHAFLLIALGTLFGGIHCAGWNLPFPTYAEQKLWRVASLAVTIIPIAVFPIAFIINRTIKMCLAIFKSKSNYDEILGNLTLIISVPVYALARLVLLGLALALLRHPPPNAFNAVDWTRFYPHLL